MTPLEVAFVQNPPSEEISDRLNKVGAALCEHGRNPCYLRCGVRSVRYRWEPIPYAERVKWLKEVSE